MGLIRMAALGALGYAGFKYFEKQQGEKHAAFAADEGGSDTHDAVRNAGPDAMADKPANWTKTDEELDETFPASDPPANY